MRKQMEIGAGSLQVSDKGSSIEKVETDTQPIARARPRTAFYVLFPWLIYIPWLVLLRFSEFGRDVLSSGRDTLYGMIWYGSLPATVTVFVGSSFVWSYLVQKSQETEGRGRLVSTLVNGILLSCLQLGIALLLLFFILVPLFFDTYWRP